MARQWLIRRGSNSIGPIPSSELKRLAVSGELRPTDLVQQHGTATWVPAGRVKGLFPPAIVQAASDRPPEIAAPAGAAAAAPAPARSRRRKVWIGAGAAAVVLSAVVAGVSRMGTNGSPEASRATATARPSGGVSRMGTNGSPEETWQVLTLVSLDYKLDGQRRPRDHSLPPYIPLLASSNTRVRDVAALSAVWEIYAWELVRAQQRRVGAAEKYVGLLFSPRPPNAQSEPTPPEVPAELKTALARAAADGALDAYWKADFATPVRAVIEERNADKVTEMSQASADFYRVQLEIGRMQAVLWDQAQGLAKAAAGATGRGTDLEVQGVFEWGKRWGSVTVRNGGAADLDHVTLSVTAPSKPIPPGNPNLDFALGASVSAGASGEDPARNANVGLNLAGSVANDRAARELPVRVFIHIPKLAVGSTCEVAVFRTSQEFAGTVAAAYSVWAPDVAVEGQPLPGYDAEKERMKASAVEAKAAAQATGRPPAAGKGQPDPADLFAKGSVWRGGAAIEQTGSRPVRRRVEITITERDGNGFKGKITYQGTRAASNIEGMAADGKVTWEVVANGKSGQPHAGEVKGRRMEVHYEGTGDGGKPQKATLTLDYVSAGKK